MSMKRVSRMLRVGKRVGSVGRTGLENLRNDIIIIKLSRTR